MTIECETSPSLTTILDLNDDCLFQVFRHFNHLDLSAITDVCTRFRQTAITYFPHFNLRHIDFSDYIVYDGKIKQRLFAVRRMNEKFGKFLIGARCVIYHTTLVVQLIQHCPNLIELELDTLSISNEMANVMRPLLKRLQKFSIRHCTVDGLLLKMLATWAVDLQEINFVHSTIHGVDYYSWNDLQLSFPKLRKCLIITASEHVEGFRRFLECNPQLKAVMDDAVNQYELERERGQRINSQENVLHIQMIRRH